MLTGNHFDDLKSLLLILCDRVAHLNNWNFLRYSFPNVETWTKIQLERVILFYSRPKKPSELSIRVHLSR